MKKNHWFHFQKKTALVGYRVITKTDHFQRGDVTCTREISKKSKGMSGLLHLELSTFQRRARTIICGMRLRGTEKQATIPHTLPIELFFSIFLFLFFFSPKEFVVLMVCLLVEIIFFLLH